MDSTQEVMSQEWLDKLRALTASNLKQFLRDRNLTQKELAEQTCVAAASLADYCNGKRMPPASFFIALKTLYGISIDDFLTKSILPNVQPSGEISPEPETVSGQFLRATYRKYCGLYFLYYFDTSKYKGRDTMVPKESLMYGILCIYENPSSLSLPGYSCAAVLGFHSREKARDFRSTLEELPGPSGIVDYISSCSRSGYFGDFELSPEHGFISLRHTATDRAFVILHRIDSNKPEYTGGIATINSVSRGRERMPVVQFLGISRYPLAMSEEEIHHSLLLNYPGFATEKEAEKLIRTFKTLYLEGTPEKDTFSDLQKSIIIRSVFDRAIEKNLQRNLFRYGKVSERDDDEWYHTIKNTSIPDPSGEASEL